MQEDVYGLIEGKGLVSQNLKAHITGKKKINKTLLPLRTPWTRLEKDDRLVESGYREICPQMKPIKNTQETPTNQ